MVVVIANLFKVEQGKALWEKKPPELAESVFSFVYKGRKTEEKLKLKDRSNNKCGKSVVLGNAMCICFVRTGVKNL